MKAFCLFFILLTLNVSFSQIEHPKASPLSTLKQEVGLSKITIEYSRPATRGRKIYGELVPYGRIWRVGANKSTKITVDTDMEVLGKRLPKGTYALYAFPEKEEWQIAFHTNTSHWGDGRKNYDNKEDLFRIKVKPKHIPYYQENFLMAFDSITHNTLNLNLIWSDIKVSIPFSVNTDLQMEEEIKKQIEKNPTAQTYYEAARYLLEQGKDVKRSLAYLNKAIELGGDTYFYYRVKSLVEAELGNYIDAIGSAKKSLKLSKELEKDEFVRMNTSNIKKWETLLENN